jgi:hypothetical protein
MTSNKLYVKKSVLSIILLTVFIISIILPVNAASTLNPKAGKDVVPILDGISKNNDGTYTAHWGWINSNSYTVVAKKSMFTGNIKKTAPKPPTSFAPGRHIDAVRIVFDGKPHKWIIITVTGGEKNAIADKNSNVFMPGNVNPQESVDEDVIKEPEVINNSNPYPNSQRNTTSQAILAPRYTESPTPKHTEKPTLSIDPVTKDSLSVWYDFEDDFQRTGIVKDISGNGNDAIIKGVVKTAPGVLGKNSISFSGNSYIQALNNPSAGKRKITISLWFQTNDPARNHKMASAAWWNGGPASGWVMGTHYPELWSDNTKSLFFSDKVDADNGFIANNWNHQVLTYDGERIKEYTNGKLINNWPSTGESLGKGNALAIGAWPSLGFYFQGNIDEFQMFDRVLDVDEINKMFNKTLGPNIEKISKATLPPKPKPNPTPNPTPKEKPVGQPSELTNDEVLTDDTESDYPEDISSGNYGDPLEVTPENPGMLEFYSTQFFGYEGRETGITVVRKFGSTGEVSVNWSVGNESSAQSDTDFTGGSTGNVSFKDGEVSKTFKIQVINDNKVESPETIVFNLSNPSGGAQLGTNISTTLSVTDYIPDLKKTSKNVVGSVKALTKKLNVRQGIITEGLVEVKLKNGAKYNPHPDALVWFNPPPEPSKPSSSDPSVVTIANSQITIVKPGKCDITGTFENKTVKMKLNSNPVELSSKGVFGTTTYKGVRKLDGPVKLPLNASIDFDLICVHPDLFKENIDKKAVWTSSNANVATVSEGKITTTNTAGTATITAKYGSKKFSYKVNTKLIGLTLQNASLPTSVKVGEVVQLKLEAVYADGTKEDVTAQASYQTNNDSLASVMSGSATMRSAGKLSVKVVYQNKFVTVKLNVIP